LRATVRKGEDSTKVEWARDSAWRFLPAVEDGADRRDTLARFVELFRIFDELHHMKEEDMLFERMLAGGFPRDSGPLAVMLAEHTRCRDLVATLAALAEQAEPWTDENRRVLNETATEYTNLLKAHIAKEDNVLYPMSERFLPDGEWKGIDRSFDEFRKKWESDGRYVDFCGRVDELREAWPAEDGPVPAGGCGF